MSRAKGWRERAQREHRCQQCGGGMLDEWKGVYCPSCKEDRNDSYQRRMKNPEKRARRQKQWKEHAKRSYQKNRDKRLSDLKADRLARKLAGLCVFCEERALEDSIWCAKHKAMQNKAAREYMRRRRAGAMGQVVQLPKRKSRKSVFLTTRLIGRPFVPPPPKPPTLCERVVEAISHFDAATNQDLQEATGISSERLSAMLRRLRLAGRIVRVRGKQGDNESAYAIPTQAKRAA